MPRMSLVVKVDMKPEKEINIEKDAETSKEVTKTTGEMGTKPEKVEQYNKYILPGKGKTPNKKLMRWSKI